MHNAFPASGGEGYDEARSPHRGAAVFACDNAFILFLDNMRATGASRARLEVKCNPSLFCCCLSRLERLDGRFFSPQTVLQNKSLLFFLNSTPRTLSCSSHAQVEGGSRMQRMHNFCLHECLRIYECLHNCPLSILSPSAYQQTPH